MDAKKFAQPYPHTLASNEVHKGNHSAEITEAQDLSYKFGRFLRAKLIGTEPDTFTVKNDFTRYKRWVDGFTDIEQQLFENPDIGLRARNEINFHAMNRHMIGLWEPIIKGDWTSDNNRVQHLNSAQNSLAIDGLYYYMARQKRVDRIGTHTIFEPEAEEFYSRTTGMIQEYDAAIILLDVMRRNRNLTILPAPLQFERINKRRNVDFIVVDFVDNKAVGVQVKTAVRQGDINTTDLDRVVFIDGTIDLGNVRAMRTHKNRSSERVVPWAGMIAAKRATSIKTHGKHSPRNAGDSRNAMQLRLAAQRLVGNIQVDHHGISTKIGERILKKL